MNPQFAGIYFTRIRPTAVTAAWTLVKAQASITSKHAHACTSSFFSFHTHALDIQSDALPLLKVHVYIAKRPRIPTRSPVAKIKIIKSFRKQTHKNNILKKSYIDTNFKKEETNMIVANAICFFEKLKSRLRAHEVRVSEVPAVALPPRIALAWDRLRAAPQEPI